MSVHIATRNRWNYLGTLLASLYQQTFQDFDLIICDDFSDEPIFANKLAMDWLEKFKNNGHGVKIIRNPVRLMIGKTRNNCIEADNWNELAVRIDDDSYCEPDYLERLHAIATGQVNKIKSKIPYESDKIFI